MKPHDSVRAFTWLFIVSFVVFLISGCGRVPPTVEGTISFLLQDERGDVEPDTTASGIPLFRPSLDAKVKALILISGLEPGRHEEYHFVWLKPDGDELFRKLESFETDRKSDRFSSTISIDPERDREMGIYEVKLYRFRSLLATAAFELRRPPELHATVELAGDYGDSPDLDYVSSDVKPLIFMKDGARVRARIPIEGLEQGFQEHLKIRWVGPDQQALFEKDEVIDPDSVSTILRSSIGIDPDRERDPGRYTVEIYRNDSILTSGSFVLQSEGS